MRKPIVSAGITQSKVHMTHVDVDVGMLSLFAYLPSTTKSNKEAWSSGWSFNSLGLNVLVGFVDWQTLFSYQIGKVYSGANAGSLLLI